ncbi:MAG: iron-sulfur cluster carrier protein ApbC [Hyphomicrobiales bacterium]|nr:MAG: iron-sulfur cluster carrier protein ApbC [Hyphomicrobiales bacterium]
MSLLTKEIVLEALGNIMDPDQGKSVVELDMVKGLVVKDGKVAFALEVDAARGQQMEPVRKACEAAVKALPDCSSVTAVLTAHSNSADAPQGGNGQAAPQAPAAVSGVDVFAPGVKQIIAVASGKGGVGKSTLAVNLAYALHAQGKRVGILDADIYGPSLPRMLGSDKLPEVTGSKMNPVAVNGIVAMSIGYLVEEDTAMIWRGPMVMSALEQMLRDVNWGELDILVVDMPPGTGDAQLTMAQRVQLAGAVVVSTPQDIALIDARKGLNMFQKVDVPVLGFVENMSYYICPSCGERAEIFGHGGAETEAKNLGINFLGGVPLDIRIRETSDSGNPITVSDPESPLAQAYMDIASKVIQGLESGDRKAAPKISMS